MAARRHVDVRPQHVCATKKEVHIDCVDEIGKLNENSRSKGFTCSSLTPHAGMEHKICFASCSCEPLPVTMARAELWPATPHNPHFAFTFSLLDWAEALMLECQVALKDFCSSLKFLCPYSALKV